MQINTNSNTRQFDMQIIIFKHFKHFKHHIW